MIQEKYIFLSSKKIAGESDSVPHVASPVKNRSQLYPDSTEICFVGNSQTTGEGRKRDRSTHNYIQESLLKKSILFPKLSFRTETLTGSSRESLRNQYFMRTWQRQSNLLWCQGCAAQWELLHGPQS